jgi:cell fate regulator YaaT (PSP1 superfamily)
MGWVGRYQAADFRVYPRGCRVICRTERGLEVGNVLCALDGPGDLPVAGTLLRQLGVEDQLIVNRLEKFRDRAFQACADKIVQRGLDSILVDVEHLFDGQSLYFYFVGEVSAELESLTAELAETYDRKVRFKKFAETLSHGCGPGCGTTASRCETSGGCASCGISGGCGSR